MQPYQLIQTVFAHDGPIRSVTYGPTENEIITGCQADAPNIRRWRLSKDLLQIEEIGSPIFHDHWVTALTSLKPSENLPPLLQKVRNPIISYSLILSSPRVVSLAVVWIQKFAFLIYSII